MNSSKSPDKPRSFGRAYTAGDLLVQIAQHEDHDHKKPTYVYCGSPRESAIYSVSTSPGHYDSWPNRTRTRALDSDSLFPPMFFPRDTLKRGSSNKYSPAVVTSTKVTLGFRIFQIASVLVVGICLYALVDNILFLLKTNTDESYLHDESRRSSESIHEQLQSWIIHGEEGFGKLPLPRRETSSENGLMSSLVSKYPIEVGQLPNTVVNHALVSSQNLTFILNNNEVCSTVRKSPKKTSSNKHKQSSLRSSASRNILISPNAKTTSSSSTPGEGIYFMIIVHSAPDHFTERQAIRSTWGSVKTLKNMAIRLIFVLGKYHKGPNLSIENSIRRENELFGDILVGNFIDSYRNLTYKHLLGYKWINNFCSGATFILKTDDDAFVDIFQLFDFISRTYGFAPTPGTLICNVFPENTKPVRAKNSRGSKWSVTMDEYPHSVYPRYCGGLAYLATPDVISKILDVSNRVKFFWIDDVFVTGVLREIAEIEPFYLNLRYLYDPAEYRNWLLPAGTSASDENDGGSKKGTKDDYEEKKSLQRMRKFPFLFAHIERGDKFSEEMNDLWRKTLRSWSR